MKYFKKEYYYPSANQKMKVHMLAYIPKGDIKGYVQFVHDCYEHIGLYEDTMKYFASEGYLVFGNDHIGHGLSTIDGKLGYIEGDSNHTAFYTDLQQALIVILNDYSVEEKEMVVERTVYKFFKKTIEKQEITKPPLRCMIGIGFGSSLVKNYAVLFEDVNVAILCSDRGITSNLRREIELCKKMTSNVNFKNNELEAYRLNIVKSKIYNEKSKFSYVSSDKKIQKLYEDDPLTFTYYPLKSEEAMLSAEKNISFQDWAKSYPSFLATLVLAGRKDPITNQSKDIEMFINKVKSTNLHNFFVKYYQNSRHNLFNDIDKEKVLKDTLHFIRMVYKQQYGD